jgi:hypothetical protein
VGEAKRLLIFLNYMNHYVIIRNKEFGTTRTVSLLTSRSTFVSSSSLIQWTVQHSSIGARWP